MARNSIVHARVDTELKDNVESILATLGLTSTDAINLMFKQIELNNGLPFDIKVPDKVVAEKRLMAELKDGEQSVSDKGWVDFNDVKSKYGV